MTVHVEISLNQLASLVGGKLYQGDGKHKITRACTLAQGKPDAIAFCDTSHSAGLRNQLNQTIAGVVLLSEDMLEHCPTAAIVVKHPRFSFMKVAQLFGIDSFSNHAKVKKQNVSTGKESNIATNVSMGPGVVVGDHCTIAEGVILGAYAVIGDYVHIGKDTRILPHVTIYNNVTIGERCIIHAGCVLGSDGFSYVPDEKNTWHRIAQLGGVRIGNDVELGAHCTVDKGSIENTVIKNGVKLDNKVHLAHNVTVGIDTIIAGCSAIAGSSHIGERCILGGSVRVGDHVNIINNVVLLGNTSVTTDLKEPGMYASTWTALPVRQWRRVIARLKHIDALAKDVLKLKGKTHD